MSAVRIIILLVGLIVAVPFVAINVWGFQVTNWVEDVTEHNEAVAAGDISADVAAPPPPVTPLNWLRDRADLRDIFLAENLTSTRYISFQRLLEPEELLTADEPLPDETTMPLYAAARAPSQLIGHCDEVLQTIGNLCDVVYSDTQVLRDDRIQITGRLAFLPTPELGDPSEVQNGELFKISRVLPFQGDLRPANDAPTRMELINAAQSFCDGLREVFGNCALLSVTFDVNELWITDLEALPPGTEQQRLDTSMRFAIYADSTEWTQIGIEEQLELLINPNQG